MASLRRALTTAPRLRPAAIANTARTTPFLPQRPASSLSSQSRPATDRKPGPAAEEASEDLDALNDPGMNGNYPDPSQTSALPLKRSLRDPYGPGDGTRWWDPVERRNYGEPVHEDNDILGVFSTEEYRHFTPGWGGVLMGCFIASVGLLCVVVNRYYPDRPSVPRTFPGGLEAELGGPKAIRARMTDDEDSAL